MVRAARRRTLRGTLGSRPKPPRGEEKPAVSGGAEEPGNLGCHPGLSNSLGFSVCGKRYKNRPGLSYHYTHTHLAEEEGEEGPERHTLPFHRKNNHKRECVPAPLPPFVPGLRPAYSPSSGGASLGRLLRQGQDAAPQVRFKGWQTPQGRGTTAQLLGKGLPSMGKLSAPGPTRVPSHLGRPPPYCPSLLALKGGRGPRLLCWVFHSPSCGKTP